MLIEAFALESTRCLDFHSETLMRKILAIQDIQGASAGVINYA